MVRAVIWVADSGILVAFIEEEKQRALRVLCIKALIQFIKALPLRPNHLPIVVGIGASTCTLKGHIQSIILSLHPIAFLDPG